MSFFIKNTLRTWKSGLDEWEFLWIRCMTCRFWELINVSFPSFSVVSPSGGCFGFLSVPEFLREEAHYLEWLQPYFHTDQKTTWSSLENGVITLLLNLVDLLPHQSQDCLFVWLFTHLQSSRDLSKFPQGNINTKLATANLSYYEHWLVVCDYIMSCTN